jgi:V8-like Glu-specific endopeptidase
MSSSHGRPGSCSPPQAGPTVPAGGNDKTLPGTSLAAGLEPHWSQLGDAGQMLVMFELPHRKEGHFQMTSIRRSGRNDSTMTTTNNSRHTRYRRLITAPAVAVAAAGLLASLASSGASASPTSTTPSAVTLSGASGQAKGTLVLADAGLAQYWRLHASSAKILTSSAAQVSQTSMRSRSADFRSSSRQGPAVKIAGTAGTIDSVGKAAPALGPNGSPWWGNFWSAPATTTGKVFFTDHKGGNWVCSGSLVNSAARNVVITAGHCVYGTAGGELPAGETWHSHWVFAPDYSNGWAPFGYWTARQLWTLTNYINNGDEQDDLGAVILNPNSSGQNAVALLGGQGIAWNQNSTQYVYDFGYPAASPFNGQTLQECDGTASWNGWWWVDMEMLSCNFTGGSSGGPWLMDFNGQWGYINSVNDANGYFLFGGQMGGLYFGSNAGALYNAVANI